MSTFVLIHGAWHGAWCWHKLVPLLQAAGHSVLTPDLPGHGVDKTPIATVTLKSYADRICQVVGEQAAPVILLGHSMGGAAITRAAENCPAMIRALIYMCAYLPRNGDSLKSLAKQDPDSLLNANIVSLAQGVLGIKPESVHEMLYGMCSDDDAEFAQSRLVPQSSQPFREPVETTPGRWGSIPRYYIECTHDRAVTHTLQREMQKRSPCRQTFTIDTDHSPFFSAPGQLAEILVQIASLSSGPAPA